MADGELLFFVYQWLLFDGGWFTDSALGDELNTLFLSFTL